MTEIVIRDLKKHFGDKKVLDGIDLTIPKGESLVIIGGSGTGKSVFFKNLIGIMTPDHGSVKYDNIDFYASDKKQRNQILDKIGVLFQGGALFDSMKIWENISFSLIHNHKIPNKKAKEIAIEKLALVGLNSDVADLYPVELSGGMQKRAALARAIAANPEIIFFDEPTSGLDPINTNIISDLIIKCSKTLGATTITITHDMQSARKIADRIGMLYQGKLAWLGKTEDIDNTENPVLQQFIHGNTEGPIAVC